MTDTTELRDKLAKALSVPQHHTGWPLLTLVEKDLYYRQADTCMSIIQPLSDTIDRQAALLQTAMNELNACKDALAQVDGSRDDVLEEAARVADVYVDRANNIDGSEGPHYKYAARVIANAIRALKGQS